jgi:hypothetical protein
VLTLVCGVIGFFLEATCAAMMLGGGV